MSLRPFTVGQVTNHIADLFRYDDLLVDIWVEGEVSDITTSRAGHIYFKLTDGQCNLSCVLFQKNARAQIHLPQQGESYILHGSVAVYEPNGSYSLQVDLVQTAGTGALALQFTQLRMKLEAEGLFDEQRKRQLPAFPQAIGVVTSREGAVWHDIQSVISRRYPMVTLILGATQVQGPAAPEQIVNALGGLAVDGRSQLIIVARGGGSKEDLSSFNDERVVRAIFASPVPVISAVGHETDWTLADLVADRRSPTPSAAAEIVTPALTDLQTRVRSFSAAGAHFARATASRADKSLQARERTLVARHPANQLAAVAHQVDGQIGSLASVVRSALHNRQQAAQQFQTSSKVPVQRRLRSDAIRLAHNRGRIVSLDPYETLKRGYAVLESPGKGVISGAANVEQGDWLIARVHDGRIDLVVDGVTVESPGGS